YLSASYELVKDLRLGGLFFNEHFKGRSSPGVSASISKDVGKWLSVLASYTISNRSYNNFGLGLSFNIKPVQLYFVGDNILRAPVSLITNQDFNNYIDRTKVFNLRVGLNIIWGRSQDSERPGYNRPKKSTDPGFIRARKRGKT